jgi:hypothetical protein
MIQPPLRRLLIDLGERRDRDVLDVETLRDLDVGIAPVQHAGHDVYAVFHQEAHQRRPAAGPADDERSEPRRHDRLLRRTEDHRGPAGRGARLDIRVDPVDRAQQRTGHDFLRLAVGHDLAARHRHEPVRDSCGEREVVEHREDRHTALVCESSDHLVELDDMADVEVGGGLIEEEHGGVLRERLREHCSTPLSPG